MNIFQLFIHHLRNNIDMNYCLFFFALHLPPRCLTASSEKQLKRKYHSTRTISFKLSSSSSSFVAIIHDIKLAPCGQNKDNAWGCIENITPQTRSAHAYVTILTAIMVFSFPMAFTSWTPNKTKSIQENPKSNSFQLNRSRGTKANLLALTLWREPSYRIKIVKDLHLQHNHCAPLVLAWKTIIENWRITKHCSLHNYPSTVLNGIVREFQHGYRIPTKLQELRRYKQVVQQQSIFPDKLNKTGWNEHKIHNMK